MKMSPDLCRSADQLSALLQGRLELDAEVDLQAHIQDCDSCRQQIERMAAEPEVWDEASLFLGDESAEENSATHPACDSGHPDRLPLQVRQVLETLGPTDDPSMLGRIGGYEVSGVVGAGGMGVVVKAHDRSLDRVVAIKVLAPHLASSGSARKRFAREAKAAAAVIHPNVIAIYGVSNEESLPYLVMPYVGGSSLQRRLDADGPFPTNEVLRIGQQIASGLAAAHGQGLVHRDIKPANIMLDGSVERVSITDFGLARAADDASMTRTGVISGTPQFMSPEQARGESIDQRSDLFSLGSVLYTMCTGRSPFRAETSYGVLRRITDEKPTPIREINPDVPLWLCQIVNRLMSKQPEDRFASAEEVSELLEECLAHVQQPATTPLPASASVAEDSDRFPPLFNKIIAAAFAFLLVVAGVLIMVDLNKGKLTIECSDDGVPIRVMQGDTVVKEMTVTKSGATVRVAAGTYVVEVDGDFDDLVVHDGSVLLKRGSNETVRITKSDSTLEEAQSASMTQADATETNIADAMEVADKFITAKLRGRKAEMESYLSASHDPNIDGEFVSEFMQVVFSKNPEFPEAHIHYRDPDDMLLVTRRLSPDKQISGPAHMLFGMKREQDGWRICEVLFFTPEECEQIVSFYKSGTRLPFLLRPERDLNSGNPDSPAPLVSAHGTVVGQDGQLLGDVEVQALQIALINRKNARWILRCEEELLASEGKLEPLRKKGTKAEQEVLRIEQRVLNGDKEIDATEPNTSTTFTFDVPESDNEALQLAKKVFAQRRQELSGLYLRYRSISNVGETPPKPLAEDSLAFMGDKLLMGRRLDPDSVLYDRKRGIWSKPWAEPANTSSELTQTPSFRGYFDGAQSVLQVSGLFGMSEHEALFADELLDASESAAAKWVGEGDDRLLQVEFSYLFESDDPMNFDGFFRVTYLLDPNKNYCPVQYSTRTRLGEGRTWKVDSFHVIKKKGHENEIWFPKTMFFKSDDPRIYNGCEVLDPLVATSFFECLMSPTTRPIE